MITTGASFQFGAGTPVRQNRVLASPPALPRGREENRVVGRVVSAVNKGKEQRTRLKLKSAMLRKRVAKMKAPLTDTQLFYIGRPTA